MPWQQGAWKLIFGGCSSFVSPILRDVFATKSTFDTDQEGKFTAALCQFFGHRGHPFPGDEATLYRHFCVERDIGSPSSRLQSVVEALRFTEHAWASHSLVQSSCPRELWVLQNFKHLDLDVKHRHSLSLRGEKREGASWLWRRGSELVGGLVKRQGFTNDKRNSNSNKNNNNNDNNDYYD